MFEFAQLVLARLERLLSLPQLVRLILNRQSLLLRVIGLRFRAVPALLEFLTLAVEGSSLGVHLTPPRVFVLRQLLLGEFERSSACFGGLQCRGKFGRLSFQRALPCGLRAIAVVQMPLAIRHALLGRGGLFCSFIETLAEFRKLMLTIGEMLRASIGLGAAFGGRNLLLLEGLLARCEIANRLVERSLR